MNYLTNLKKYRESKQLTQKDVAKYLQIGTTSYQKYELGTREPSIEKLIALAKYFNVSIDYLVGLRDEP